MFPRSKFSITLWATVCTSLLFAAIVSGLALAQQTTAERVRGSATVSTSQVKGEVVLVEGNDLLVKLSTGDLKTFHVPETRKFHIDGRELSVHDLQPGTTLTATVKTTTTPVTVRTKSRLSGRVWFVAAPTVILTLPDGQNKQYVVKQEDNVRFTIEGRPATVFDLRKGMTVSAEKIVEAPDVEITADTSVVGHAPALQAAAPRPAPPLLRLRRRQRKRSPFLRLLHRIRQRPLLLALRHRKPRQQHLLSLRHRKPRHQRLLSLRHRKPAEPGRACCCG